MDHPTQSPEGKTQNITLGLILSWAVGVVLVTAGIGFVFTSPLSGIIVLIGGLIMLPPVNDFFRKKSNVNLSGGVRFIIAIILVAVGAGMVTSEAVSTASNTTNNSGTSTSSTNNASAQAIEIVDISTRVTESNSVWSKFAWNLTLKNNTDRSRSVRAEIKWVDKDGFVVDSATEYSLSIPAGEEKTFNDYILIDASSAGDVDGVKAEIK